MTRTPAPATRPTPQNGTVPPRPVPHAERRPREYLTPKEVERLITAARQNRYGHRDATMIRVAYRHGLRVSELCALRWVGLPPWRCCWRIRRVQAGCAMSRTKVDWRVRANGWPASQAATRTRLRAAAVSTCWRWTFARPMERARRR